MKVWEKDKIEKTEKHYTITKKITIILAILMFFIQAFIPIVFLLVIALLIEKSRIKRQKKARAQLDKENLFINSGYKKICNEIYLKENEKKINILDKDYGFSQIVDCNLEINEKTFYHTIANNNTKNIYTLTNTFEHRTIKSIYLNIIVEDFENPNLIVPVASKEQGQKLESMLKIIISKNGEKYIDNGTITKIEHKYITEETAQEQIKKLSELYRDGILTEYEYSMKKQELLEKIK